MNELVEVRSSTVAFELRNGVKVEYAAGDREARMRALGCPETILKRVREKRSAAVARRNDSLMAASDEARRSACAVQGQKIAAHTDADLKARAARLGQIIAAEDQQAQKDSALLERMQSAAGIVAGKRHS